MSMHDPRWINLGGQPVSGVIPARVIVRSASGDPTLSADQNAALMQYYRRFCDNIHTSSFKDGYHYQRYTVADGTVMHMESIAGVHKVQIFVPSKKALMPEGLYIVLREQLNREDQPFEPWKRRLYVLRISPDLSSAKVHWMSADPVPPPGVGSAVHPETHWRPVTVTAKGVVYSWESPAEFGSWSIRTWDHQLNQQYSWQVPIPGPEGGYAVYNGHMIRNFGGYVAFNTISGSMLTVQTRSKNLFSTELARSTDTGPTPNDFLINNSLGGDGTFAGGYAFGVEVDQGSSSVHLAEAYTPALHQDHAYIIEEFASSSGHTHRAFATNTPPSGTAWSWVGGYGGVSEITEIDTPPPEITNPDFSHPLNSTRVPYPYSIANPVLDARGRTGYEISLGRVLKITRSGDVVPTTLEAIREAASHYFIPDVIQRAALSIVHGNPNVVRRSYGPGFYPGLLATGFDPEDPLPAYLLQRLSTDGSHVCYGQGVTPAPGWPNMGARFERGSAEPKFDMPYPAAWPWWPAAPVWETDVRGLKEDFYGIVTWDLSAYPNRVSANPLYGSDPLIFRSAYGSPMPKYATGVLALLPENLAAAAAEGRLWIEYWRDGYTNDVLFDRNYLLYRGDE